MSYTASSTALSQWSPHNRALASVLLKAGSRALTADQIRGRMVGARRALMPRLQEWQRRGLVQATSLQGRIVWAATEKLRDAADGVV